MLISFIIKEMGIGKIVFKLAASALVLCHFYPNRAYFIIVLCSNQYFLYLCMAQFGRGKFKNKKL